MATAERDDRLEPPTEEQLLEEFEAERPGRKLTGFPAPAVGLLALVAVGYAAVTADELVRRAADPEPLDVVFGVVSVALVLEATRRTVGWILPAIVIAFVAYGYLGGLIPDS